MAGGSTRGAHARSAFKRIQAAGTIVLGGLSWFSPGMAAGQFDALSLPVPQADVDVQAGSGVDAQYAAASDAVDWEEYAAASDVLEDAETNDGGPLEPIAIDSDEAPSLATAADLPEEIDDYRVAGDEDDLLAWQGADG
ncbi:MAG: hypothetical protein KDA61_19695, partial [Planctomycetales bacterium]|nr:hypothetical protein [Planctomycetales bacterium]